MRNISGHIKTLFISVLLLFLFIPEAFSQYVKSSVSLAKTHNSGVNWIDIDGDGDLDLSISGDDLGYSYGFGKLYLNSGSPTFTISYKRDIRAIEDGDQKWSDFNNDGYPDLLYAGEDVGRIAGIDTFKVSDAALPYYNKYSGFTAVSDGSVDWGDYDNDGDYDVLIAGQDASGLIVTDLYRNDRSAFTKVNAGLPGVILGKVAFIDYDLDMDLDIFISGRDINTNKYTRLWKNTGGAFQVTSDVFVNLEFSQFDWGDFNDDGYPDLILGGSSIGIALGYIYYNNSGTGFTLSGMKVPGARYGSSAFGDVDNDGDLDAFISGYKAKKIFRDKYIFLNNGTDSLIPLTSFTSDTVSRSFIQFGDYNSDNKLDFVTNGMDAYSNGLTYIADNTTATANTKPSAPQNLHSTVEGKNVILSWDPSTDNNTAPKALTYNIYMGKTSGGINIVSPNASIATGFRRVSRQGYIQDTAWMIRNLPVGIYHWGVQAMDNALGASAFSAEEIFEIKERFTKVPYTEDPSSTSPAVYFDSDYDNDLDMVLNYSTPALKIAENVSGSFSQANYKTALDAGPYYIYTITPNDYDNNNLIDLTISGNYLADNPLDSTIALLGYKSAFTYEFIDSALLKNANFEYVLWSDLNNDGLQDLITSGKTLNLDLNNKPVTYILKNKGDGNFQKILHAIRGFEKTGAVAADFDNDLDNDLIIYGKDSLGIANTYLYINNGDFNFSENLIPNNELYRNYLDYQIYSGDFDLNGELDIYMAGVTLASDKYVRVLLNHGLNFTDANLPLRSAAVMSNFWADYDYDGDLDIYMVTAYTAPDKARLYLNNAGILEEIITELTTGQQNQLDLPFTAVNLDNDNGLDFIMKVNAGTYNQYYDNWGSNERITTAPANTRYDQDKLDIILKWNKLSECPACTYNIRVGAHPDSIRIVSPMSDIITGYRYVVQPGNAGLNDSWKLCDLPVGTYYWSVQAVDPSNTGGPWAPIDAFTVSHIDADFSFTTVCLGDSTAFTDLTVATDPVTKWKWSFGDGASSTLKNPKHLYTAAGVFSTGLWAYTIAGDSAYVNYNVQVKAVPVAGFSANIACQGTPTTFTNTTNTNGLTILNWLWNFGDGESSNLQNPGTHGYLNPGDYQTNLVVTADNGCADLITKTVTAASYPVAMVTSDGPLTFCKGDSVTLSTNFNSSYTYKWMIGGTGLTGADSSKYVARLSGNYTVEVVNPSGNCRDTSLIAAVTAQDSPAAPLITSGSSTVFCEGDSVILSVTNIPGYTYQWKRDGGAIGINSNQYTAKASGTYSLTVSNSTGCEADATNPIYVTVNTKPALPTVNINGSATFCEGASVELSVTDNPALTFLWEESGIAITGATAHNYNAQTTGSYSLKITDSNGCFNRSENIAVNVITPPSSPLITASGALEFCQGDSVVLSVTKTLNYSYLWKVDGGATGSDSNQLVVRASGAYSLTVSHTINTTTCSANSANVVNVIVNPNPAIPTVSLSGNTNFCEGGKVTIDVTSSPDNTYNWRNQIGLISGATSNSYVAGTSGTYQLEVIDIHGCISWTSPVEVTVKPTPARPVITSMNYTEGVCPGKNPIRLSVSNTAPDYRYTWIKNGELQYNDTLKYIEFYEKGTYKIRAELGGCTSESDAKIITLPDAPEKPVVYVRGPVVWYMAASSNTADRYQWYRNGEQIQGATRYIYVANKTPGTYKVAVGNQNECYTMSDDITIPLAKSQMTNFYIPWEFLVGEDRDLSASIQVYPNPTTGLITIEMENDLFGNLDMSIITEQGKEIKIISTVKTTEHFSTEVDLSSRPEGIYIINMQIDNYSITRKVILE